MVVSVAVQESADGLEDFVKDITFPVLIDREHVLTELYAISNVPTVLWIDENDRIVRPNANMFGSDTFREITGIDSGAQKDLIRDWVRSGTVALPDGADSAAGLVGDLTDDEVRARLHFRIGAHLLREGDEDGGREHLTRAGELAPHDFTIRRAAMPLLGQNPFGDEFFALYGEWQQSGSPYHGIPADRSAAG